VPRTQTLLAHGVVGSDLLAADAREVEQEGTQEPRPVLPSDAVDDDATFPRAGDRAHAAAAFSRKYSRKVN
jgi:hypothetical protein